MENLAIISGWSSGLGFEIAKLLIQRQYKVLILGRNSKELELSATKLNNIIDWSVISSECDISKQEDIDLAMSKIKGKYIITHLFNNAGVGKFWDPENNTEDLIDEVLWANLKWMILLTKSVLENTSDENWAMIVNIMSTAALVARSNESLYCASKWGARWYTEALKVYTKWTKYKVVWVYPGGMNTSFWENSWMEPDVSKFMDPVDVANKVVNDCLNIDSSWVSDITINRI